MFRMSFEMRVVGVILYCSFVFHQSMQGAHLISASVRKVEHASGSEQRSTLSVKQHHTEYAKLLEERLQPSSDIVCAAVEVGDPSLLQTLATRNTSTLKGSQGLSPLGMAIQRHSYDLVRVLVTCGAEASAEELHEAVEKEDTELVDILVHRSNCDSKKDGVSLIERAAQLHHGKMVALLLSKGADASQDVVCDVIAGGAVELFPKLLNSYNCNLKDSRGLLPLSAAIKGRHETAIAYLKTLGAHVPMEVVSGAVRTGDEALVRRFACKDNVNYKKDAGMPPLRAAIDSKATGIMLYLIELGAEKTRAELYYAVATNDLDVVKMIITPENVKNGDKLWRNPLIKAVEHRNIEMARFLVAQGATSCQYVLREAIETDDPTFVEAVVNKSNIRESFYIRDAVDKSKSRTVRPLEYAVMRKHLPVITYLWHAGAWCDIFVRFRVAEACELEIAKLLGEESSSELLCEALRRMKRDVVDYVLASGVPITASIAVAAVASGDISYVREFVTADNVSGKALAEAIRTGDENIILYIEKLGAKKDFFVACAAVQTGDMDLMTRFVTAEAVRDDCNRRHTGTCPLSIAVLRKDCAAISFLEGLGAETNGTVGEEVVRSGDTQLCDRLIGNAWPSWDPLPEFLKIAVQQEDESMVKHLLAQGHYITSSAFEAASKLENPALFHMLYATLIRRLQQSSTALTAGRYLKWALTWGGYNWRMYPILVGKYWKFLLLRYMLIEGMSIKKLLLDEANEKSITRMLLLNGCSNDLQVVKLERADLRRCAQFCALCYCWVKTAQVLSPHASELVPFAPLLLILSEMANTSMVCGMHTLAVLEERKIEALPTDSALFKCIDNDSAYSNKSEAKNIVRKCYYAFVNSESFQQATASLMFRYLDTKDGRKIFKMHGCSSIINYPEQRVSVAFGYLLEKHLGRLLHARRFVDDFGECMSVEEIVSTLLAKIIRVYFPWIALIKLKASKREYHPTLVEDLRETLSVEACEVNKALKERLDKIYRCADSRNQSMQWLSKVHTALEAKLKEYLVGLSNKELCERACLCPGMLYFEKQALIFCICGKHTDSEYWKIAWSTRH